MPNIYTIRKFELRKVWGIGPFKRRKFLAIFENQFVAESVMSIKLHTAKRRGKKLVLELIDVSTGEVISRKASK